jgi:hypothetical protein
VIRVFTNVRVQISENRIFHDRDADTPWTRDFIYDIHCYYFNVVANSEHALYPSKLAVTRICELQNEGAQAMPSAACQEHYIEKIIRVRTKNEFASRLFLF